MPEPGAAPMPDPVPGPSIPMPSSAMATMPFPGAPSTSVRMGAAKALVGVTVGMLIGAWVAGPRGAGAGVAVVGTLLNANRARTGWSAADPELRVEAGKSATMAVFGAGIAGMLLYQEWKARNE